MARRDPRLLDSKAQIAVELLQKGVEIHTGVRLAPGVEVGGSVSAPWSARSVRDVVVKGVLRFKFW